MAIGLVLAVPLALRGEEAPEITKGIQALYRGDYDSARSEAAGYLKSHPDSAEAHTLLARSEIAQGRYTLAYGALRHALELDPTNIDALYYLGRVCTILSQIEFRRLIETAPGSQRAHQLIAESYLMQHRNADAEKEYRAALEANPRSMEILDALGELKRTDFKFSEALAYYSRALQLAPRDYTSTYGSGACQLFQNDLQSAISSFRRALEIDPSSAAAHLALGDALLRTGQPAAAVAELKSAISLIPSMRQAYILLSRAYHKLGQTNEANKALATADELARQEIRARQLTGDNGGVLPSQHEQPHSAELPNPEP
jgi:protein O-GlcNAc transferase